MEKKHIDVFVFLLLKYKLHKKILKKINGEFKEIFNNIQNVMKTIHSHFKNDILDQHNYVFIPVEDGGFALIGSVLFSPQIFQNVPWNSNLVMSQIRENLKKFHYSWAELPALWDVDEFVDYKRLSLHMPHLTRGL